MTGGPVWIEVRRHHHDLGSGRHFGLPFHAERPLASGMSA